MEHKPAPQASYLEIVTDLRKPTPCRSVWRTRAPFSSLNMKRDLGLVLSAKVLLEFFTRSANGSIWLDLNCWDSSLFYLSHRIFGQRSSRSCSSGSCDVTILDPDNVKQGSKES